MEETQNCVWIDPCVMSGGFGAWSAVGYYRWYIECNMLREIEARLRNNRILIPSQYHFINDLSWGWNYYQDILLCFEFLFWIELTVVDIMLCVQIKVTDHSENTSIRILATQRPSHPSLVPWIQSRKFKCESYDWWRAPSDGKTVYHENEVNIWQQMHCCHVPSIINVRTTDAF